MKYISQEKDIDIPKQVTVTVKARIVKVVGPRGELTKSFKHVPIDIAFIKNGQLRIKVYHGIRKHIACIRTVASHIENMIKGVTIGFEYKMRFVYAHFPINANISDDKNHIEIRNFLGDKNTRRIQLLEGVSIELSAATKDEVVLTGNDIQNVSQSAASIRHACSVKNKDIRKFLDGIYVSEKGNIVKPEFHGEYVCQNKAMSSPKRHLNPLPFNVTNPMSNHVIQPKAKYPSLGMNLEKPSIYIVILNQPIPRPSFLFERIWNIKKMSICVDGGANHLSKYAGLNATATEIETKNRAIAKDLSKELFIPDMILGDLDSITPQTTQLYTSYGVSMLKTPDQEKTDFEKTLDFISQETHVNNTSLHDPVSEPFVYVFGALTGRLDHTLTHLFAIHTTSLHTILISPYSLAWVLPLGLHTLHIDPRECGPTCGIFSMLGTVRCVTKGLVWDLTRDVPLEYGKVLSTSNAFRDEAMDVKLGVYVVKVECDGPVVWTVERTQNQSTIE